MRKTHSVVTSSNIFQQLRKVYPKYTFSSSKKYHVFEIDKSAKGKKFVSVYFNHLNSL